MNWLQKLIKQSNRIIPGLNISEDATEAETLEALENTEPVTAFENSDVFKEINSRLSVLEKIDLKKFVSQESLTEVNEKIDSVVKASNANKALVESTKTELATEINSVKAVNSATQTNTQKPEVTLEEQEQEDEKNESTINMSQMMAGTSVHPLIK